MAHAEQINPAILAWARETAGLPVAEAAEKLGLKDTRRQAAADKLMDLETGQRRPTRPLLLKAAAVYRRPLLTFYMEQPPRRAERGQDFRAATGARSPRDDALLDALLRDIRARQQMLRAVLEDEEEAEPLPFVGSARIEHGVPRVVASIRTALQIDEQSQKQARGPDGLFALLRRAAEGIGIFVLLAGDLGSHHTAIGDDVFRGYVIADEIAPLIVINDQDARTARSFTLLHELAHIWLGASGVSGPLREEPGDVVERFCNDVAGRFLYPEVSLSTRARLVQADPEEIFRVIQQAAKEWNVSQGVVTYRLARERAINAQTAGALFQTFAARWREEKARQRTARGEDEGGPSYYIVRRSKLGSGLLNVVRRNLRGELLTHTDAAKILGVSPASVERLLAQDQRVA